MFEFKKELRYLVIISTIILNYSSGFCAAIPNIDSAVTADINFTNTGIDFTSSGVTTTYDPGAVNITGTNPGDPGYVNGNITTSVQFGGFVNINTDYNTVRQSYSTNFGTSSASLGNVNVNNSTLNISNNFYVGTLNLNNSTLILNNTANIAKIENTGGATNIVITGTHNYQTLLGTSTNSINSLTLDDNAKMYILDYSYVDNVYLGNSSTLYLSYPLYGTISSSGPNPSSSGSVVIIDFYDDNNGATKFGTSTNTIKELSIANSRSLTLSAVAYIDSLIIDYNGSLNLNSGSGINGTIKGVLNVGTLNLNRNYDTSNTSSSDYFNTTFGTSGSAINILNLGISGTAQKLTLGNTAYINNLNLSDTNSTLTLDVNGGVNGTIIGGSDNFGIVNIDRIYDTYDSVSIDYHNTTFGKFGNSIKTLNIGTSTVAQTLTLGNLAYVNNIVLSNSAAVLNLQNGSGLMGTVYGNGIVNVLEDYSTTNGAANIFTGLYNANFGTSTNSIGTLNIGANLPHITSEIVSTLNLDNTAYVSNRLNISDNSVLNITQNGSVNGIIQGMEDGQGNVNITNRDYNTTLQNTIFGTLTKALKTTTITNHTFTLTNIAYIDKFTMINNSNYTDVRRLLTMENTSQFNGSLSLDVRSNDRFIGVVQDETYMNDLANLLTLMDTGKSGTADINTNNEVFLSIIDMNTMTEGKVILLSSGKDYSNAGLTYDGIFLDLKLQKSPTDLYLVVKQNRVPTTNVSQATITASTEIDSWKYYQKSHNENILTANLQAIENKNDFFHALTNLAPDVSGLNAKIPTQSIMSAVANIEKRLNFLRTIKITEKNDTFMRNLSKHMPNYYDEYVKKRNLWWEFFGGNLKQQTTENVFGYNANFYGATVGYDALLKPNFVLGMSYTFNLVDANDLDYIKDDRDDLTAMTNNLDVYMMFYNKWNYLALNLGAGYNDYEQKRKINFYNFDKTAKANYDGYSYHLGVEYGINLMLYDSQRARTHNNKERMDYYQLNRVLNSYTAGNKRNFVMLTPKVSLTYNNIIVNDYIETGADAASLEIKTKDYETLDLNGGLTLTLNKGISSTTNFQTMLTGFVSYGIANNKVELDARYVDDDKFFKVYGIEVPDLTYNAGIGFNLNFYDKIDLGLSFNYTFADKFTGLMGKLSMIYSF